MQLTSLNQQEHILSSNLRIQHYLMSSQSCFLMLSAIKFITLTGRRILVSILAKKVQDNFSSLKSYYPEGPMNPSDHPSSEGSENF
jgi:hypothetical protein